MAQWFSDGCGGRMPLRVRVREWLWLPPLWGLVFILWWKKPPLS